MLFDLLFDKKQKASQEYVINTNKGYLIYDGEEISFTDNWAEATTISEDIFVYHREDIRMQLLEKYDCIVLGFQMI